MRILITTGIYPPATSGPAQYAAALEAELRRRGHEVVVATYGRAERALPVLLRHKWFFWRVFFKVRRAEVVLALDTLSVGWPTSLATRVWRRKFLIRTGGDFLYETYTERTGELVLLSKFYASRLRLNWKERLIFRLTKKTLHRASALIFSTAWQRDIWFAPYSLEKMSVAGKIFIVENRFDEKISDAPMPAPTKNFIFATRMLSYKNIERFTAACTFAREDQPEIFLEIYHNLSHAELLEKIKTCYACVMPSLGEVSPHFILDALRCNRPFLLTRESGFAEKLRDVAILIDPLSINDMKEKILWLADDAHWAQMHAAVQNFSYTHSWGQITDEFLEIIHKI